MTAEPLVISLLGSSGGVAKAVLSILNKSVQDPLDPLHSHIIRSRIHLIDWKQKGMEYYESFASHLTSRLSLHQFDLRNKEAVLRHLSSTATTLVVDVSWADTVEMVACCDELGISYVNTALEIASVDENEKLEGFTLLERYRIFEANRDRFTNVKGIIGSGMNPGIVQWMAFELMNGLPGEQPLGCYIVETDNTFYKDTSRIKEKTVYSSWSPECFLDEAVLNYPMFVKRHMPLMMYSQVYELEFKVSLDKLQFYGSLMPHEEVLSMGRHYDMELGFIYKVNDYTINLIRSNLHDTSELFDWQHQVFDPAEAELVGEDLVGVLLVYKDKERFMYNVMDNPSVFAEFGTNATYLQVACGVYGAVCSIVLDPIDTGLYFVDELLIQTSSNYGRYVSYYMKSFVTGDHAVSEGLLLDRMKKII